MQTPIDHLYFQLCRKQNSWVVEKHESERDRSTEVCCCLAKLCTSTSTGLSVCGLMVVVDQNQLLIRLHAET